MITATSGHLVHRLFSRTGLIEVRENRSLRWMHFGSNNIQTAMSLSNPTEIALPYLIPTTRLLALFAPQMKSLLLLGLGGAALPRYLNQHYPATKVTTIEYAPAVIDIANRYFYAGDLANHDIIVTNAASYLSHPAEQYDVLLSDIYTNDSLPKDLLNPDFYQDCYHALDTNGIALFNWICDSNAQFIWLMEILRGLFHKQTLCVSMSGYRNIIVIASKKPGFFQECQALATAGYLSQCYYDVAIGLSAEGVGRIQPS